ncbi:unnamed protein product, partial [Rotaria sp. Silwood1]
MEFVVVLGLFDH